MKKKALIFLTIPLFFVFSETFTRGRRGMFGGRGRGGYGRGLGRGNCPFLQKEGRRVLKRDGTGPHKDGFGPRGSNLGPRDNCPKNK